MPMIKEQKEYDLAELRLGWIRYEKLRKLSPFRYKQLWELSLKSGKAFDDLVDSLEDS